MSALGLGAGSGLADDGVYYHGGAPGLRPHQSLLPAADLGLVFNYNQPWVANETTYDATKVYLTRHLGSALGYASRYIDKYGNAVPGDVYEVRPLGTPTPDPDYKHLGLEGLFVRCRSAKIVRVVERGVQLDVREQNRLAWPHNPWEAGRPMYTEDGQMIASEQMRAHGVTDEYMALLPKWADVSEVNAAGAIPPAATSGHPTKELFFLYMDQLLEFFSHVPLDRAEHQISPGRAGWVKRTTRYTCSCGSRFDEVSAAARHQAAEPELRLIAERNLQGLPDDPFDHLLAWLAARGGQRWAWYFEHDSR
jgi:hypothetical protein